MADDTARTKDHVFDAGPSEMELRPTRGLSGRVLRMLQDEPVRPMPLNGSWLGFAAAACAASAVLALAIWVSAHVHPDPVLRNVALFVHLASLVLGFGAVLVADYFIILWVIRRFTFAEAIGGVARLQMPIWIGLLGLVLSGVLLNPDLAGGMTRVKLVFIALLTLNGLQATILGRRMEASAGELSVQLLIWGAVTTTVSQVCWWGSVWIGFWNASSTL